MPWSFLLYSNSVPQSIFAAVLCVEAELLELLKLSGLPVERVRVAGERGNEMKVYRLYLSTIE